MANICGTAGCGRPMVARGLCGSCYNRAKRSDPNFVKRIFNNDVARFKSHLSAPVGVAGCVLWEAATNRDGYGIFAVGRSTMLAHRYNYLHIRGLTIGKGLILGHTCIEFGADRNNPACVAHCRPMTQAENMLLDCAGQDNYQAIVSDAMIKRAISFYNASNGSFSMQRLADLLTRYGYPTSKTTIFNWVHRKGRTASPDWDNFFGGGAD